MNTTTTRSFNTISIEVTLEAPFLIHSADAGRFGLDATELVDHNGKLILPASLLKGRIRDAMQLAKNSGLTSAPDCNYWLGKEGFTLNDEGGQRARIWTEDLACQTETPIASSTPHDQARIKIDKINGTVEPGALQNIQQTLAARTELSFGGKWRVWANEIEIKQVLLMIRAGLAAQSQLGGERSIGFGRLKSVTVGILENEATTTRLTNPNPNPNPNQTTCLEFTLATSDAFCVAASTPQGNVFVSQNFLTGGTIKGALAQMLLAKTGAKNIAAIKECSKLAEHFDSLRITHALPCVPEAPRPLPIAQSIVKVLPADAQPAFFDVSLHKDAVLPNGKAAAFQIDWKEKNFDALREEPREEKNAFTQGKTATHLRVRTKIDDENRVAEDGKLFAYECCYAGNNIDKDNLQTTTVWKCTVTGDNGALNELLDLLRATHNQIGPIGKTDAFFTVSTPVGKTAEEPLVPQGLRQGETQIRLLLRSDALLFTTEEAREKAATPKGLHALYAAAFCDLSGNTLTLSHFFATQKLVGGAVLQQHQRRYQQQHKKEQHEKSLSYEPWVLTEAGSVFVLNVAQGQESQVQDKLKDWQNIGLPLPTTVIASCSACWQYNPYLRENGYGEVAVNPTLGVPFYEA